jgi:hypothetical protein
MYPEMVRSENDMKEDKNKEKKTLHGFCHHPGGRVVTGFS